MIPPARDPRMDRGVRPATPWRPQLGAVDPRGAPWWWGGSLVVMVCALAMAWPRVAAFEDLAAENYELRARLLHMERQLDEVERVSQRLRLYDAQLRSLTEATGDAGGMPANTLSGHEADPLEAGSEGAPQTDTDAPLPDVEIAEGDEPDEPVSFEEASSSDLRPAEAWAFAVQERMDAFLGASEEEELDLNALMADLETLRALRAALPQRWPAEGHLSSGVGWRRDPINGGTKFHAGLDISNKRGTPIYAVSPGTVVRSGYHSGYGRLIEIDHGFGITTRYAHCTTLRKRAGDRVSAGDFIATMGSTGRSTGSHLHFELRVDGSAHDALKYLPR